MSVPAELRLLRHFVAIAPLSGTVVRALLEYALGQKRRFLDGQLEPSLRGKTLAMIFEKPSLRTRVSFEVAMTQLGGHAICLDQSQIGLGQRESVEDAARVISRMCDGIMVRTFSQQVVEQLAASATVPVINGLTDELHPCQAMADMMTIAEHFGGLGGRTVVFVGDGNNVARSLGWACAKLGVNFVIAGPRGYQLDGVLLSRLRGQPEAGTVEATEDARSAVGKADVIYTDTWVSMGQEQQRQQRLRELAGYQVNAELLERAGPQAVVMHCLPAHRGVEISAEVLDGPRSIVWQQAENRLHLQRALLELLMSRGGGAAGR